MLRWTMMLCAVGAFVLGMQPAMACPKGKTFMSWKVKRGPLLKKWGSRLKSMAAFIKERPGRVLILAAHTNSRGRSRFNKKISQRRADKVKAALIKHGVAKSRIIAKGFGEACPIASNRTRAGRQRNSRIDFMWKKKK